LLLIILGISVIKFGLMPEVPVLFTVCLLVFLA
jgi:NhaC family Na+:H+ antiporter